MNKTLTCDMNTAKEVVKSWIVIITPVSEGYFARGATLQEAVDLIPGRKTARRLSKWRVFRNTHTEDDVLTEGRIKALEMSGWDMDPNWTPGDHWPPHVGNGGTIFSFGKLEDIQIDPKPRYLTTDGRDR